jgi:hypothetical protein
MLINNFGERCVRDEAGELTLVQDVDTGELFYCRCVVAPEAAVDSGLATVEAGRTTVPRKPMKRHTSAELSLVIPLEQFDGVRIARITSAEQPVIYQ